MEDLIKDVEAGAQDVALNGHVVEHGGAPAQIHGPMSDELEDGELEEEPERLQTYTNNGSTEKIDV